MQRAVRILLSLVMVSSVLLACSSKQNSAKPLDHSQDSQQENDGRCPRSEEIAKRLNEINHCETAADCTHSTGFSSQYMCPIPVNRRESLDEIGATIAKYVKEKCPNAPMTDCYLGKGFSCEQNKCVQN